MSVLSENYGRAVGLVEAYMSGDAASFASSLSTVRPSVVIPLVEGIHALLSRQAEEEGIPLDVILERFCLAGRRIAQEPLRDDMPWHGREG